MNTYGCRRWELLKLVYIKPAKNLALTHRLASLYVYGEKSTPKIWPSKWMANHSSLNVPFSSTLTAHWHSQPEWLIGGRAFLNGTLTLDAPNHHYSHVPE